MDPVRRRAFLIWAIGGVTAALVAAAGTVIGVFLVEPSAETPRIRLPKRVADLAEGDVIRIRAPVGWAMVMADGGGVNRAGEFTREAFVVRSCGRTAVLAATCSHLGCALNYSAEQIRFECPCHGSRYVAACTADGGSKFSVEGKVLHGPAKYPMAHIRWTPATAPDELVLEMDREYQ